MANAYPKRKQTKRPLTHIGCSAIVAAFTKDAAYQVLRVSQGKDGSIYLEIPIRKADWHYSYHASGEVHSTFVTHVEKGRFVITKQQPLAKFRGFANMGVFAFVKSYLSGWKELAKSRERKSQMILCLDLSRFSDPVNMNCFLVEKGRVDLLPTLVRLGSQLLVITTTNPWVALLVYSPANLQLNIESSPEG